jgi:phosphoenolpyruvate-protein kinase (PTS system EI component)
MNLSEKNWRKRMSYQCKQYQILKQVIIALETSTWKSNAEAVLSIQTARNVEQKLEQFEYTHP